MRILDRKSSQNSTFICVYIFFLDVFNSARLDSRYFFARCCLLLKSFAAFSFRFILLLMPHAFRSGSDSRLFSCILF